MANPMRCLLAWFPRLLIRLRLLCLHGRLAPCQACIIAKVQARLGYVPLTLDDELRDLD